MTKETKKERTIRIYSEHGIVSNGEKLFHPVLLEHSTSYKAEKDPLFPVVKALIESQSNDMLQSVLVAD